MNIFRERLHISGIVQGVGFRPFIYRLAGECRLNGFVKNNSRGVLIEIEGEQSSITQFYRKLIDEPPPGAQIKSVKSETVKVLRSTDFLIIDSGTDDLTDTLISPDIALCDDCLSEMNDGRDRRFQYPFINCTNCGPRYTIIKSIPYDRPNTSMHNFEMCPDCKREYMDPTNRRFHAQPVACPVCGPQLALIDNKGGIREVENIVAECARLIKLGKIIAIRGMGGFHFTVDPFNSEALNRLRSRKGRQDKPFALMAADVNTIRKYCHVSGEEYNALQSPVKPIVILKVHQKSELTENAAPANNYLGFMLPYTPLHHLLLQCNEILVMTSANFTDEPIAVGNEEAFERLRHIADYFVFHNREILQRCDDSIVRIVNNKEQLIRRSRGYVPAPVFINSPTIKNILAVGGELKNCVALSRGDEVIFSQYIGDLDNPSAFSFFENSIIHLQDIMQIKPEIIVCDMHPEYLSTKWALNQHQPVLSVQHHHAHLASVLADNKLDEAVIGVILDGSGFGLDGTIWGGEILVGDRKGYERFAWLDPTAMPGGSAAIKEPWRMAFAFLKKVFGQQVWDLDLPLIKNQTGRNLQLIDQMIDQNINTPLTSGCGRLFDAVSAILDIRTQITFEAQAAIELEMLSDENEKDFYNECLNENKNFKNNLSLRCLIKSLVKDRIYGKPTAEIAAKFQNTLARLLLQSVIMAADESGLKKVALSGGVYQNIFFLKVFNELLVQAGLEVILHNKVPANDGGLALGQIMIADYMIRA
jgi:hydrogenase maturation protein HypF